jgi:succinate dehydrogenase / fumarate reductase cytochrome b subunit
MHRITGVGAFLGSVCVMLWLVSLAWDASLYGFLQIVVVSIPVQILLFLWTLSFIYHLLNGVRHLVWDAGKGLELPEIYKSGKIVMILALSVTVLIWIIRLAS